MSGPLRIQRKRTKGWRMPENTVSVTRPGKHGNPYYPNSGMSRGFFDENMRMCQHDVREPRVQVQWFREHVEQMRRESPTKFAGYIAPLRGRNLACWCALCPKHDAAGGKPLNESCPDCAPCHVDPLGEIANAPAEEVAA